MQKLGQTLIFYRADQTHLIWTKQVTQPGFNPKHTDICMCVCMYVRTCVLGLADNQIIVLHCPLDNHTVKTF